MNDPDPIDLSSLDPERDPARWHAFVEATRARVDEVVALRCTHPVLLIASWARPVLIAAMLLLAVLIPAEYVLELRETEAERLEWLAQESTDSARGMGQPTGAELLVGLLGGGSR